MYTRRIILIDVENFNGGPIATPSHAQWCRRMVDHWIQPMPSDLVVLAAEASTVTNLHASWRGCRILAGWGSDGADNRLLEVMEEDLPQRFTELVLVSGDNIFAEKISQLAAQGLPTTVYSHSESLSKRLQLAATAVVTSIPQSSNIATYASLTRSI